MTSRGLPVSQTQLQRKRVRSAKFEAEFVGDRQAIFVLRMTWNLDALCPRPEIHYFSAIVDPLGTTSKHEGKFWENSGNEDG